MCPAQRSISSVSAADLSPLAQLLALGRPLVMGILNVTPDSFSDGSQFFDPATAIAHARQMVDDGADLIDVGAESTRPYGDPHPVPLAEELARLEPVLPAVIALGRPVSVDTIKAKIAEWALVHGAAFLTEVGGHPRDPEWAPLVAQRRVPVIVMHNRDKADPTIDIMADIMAFFQRSLDIAERAGIVRGNIVLDPGIGFGKTPEQSIVALGRLNELTRFGRPMLVGASRKRFIASVAPSEPQQRLGGSIAAHLLAVQKGAAIVRAHDVAETVQALRVAAAIGGAS